MKTATGIWLNLNNLHGLTWGIYARAGFPRHSDAPKRTTGQEAPA